MSLAVRSVEVVPAPFMLFKAPVKVLTIRGRDLTTGLPKMIEITPNEIEEALRDNVVKIINETKKDTTITKQLLRSATSVGANINEAIYGNSKADFISKLHISLKETGESIYWLTLLKRTNLIEYNFDELLSLAEEIKRMLIASLNTAKENK